MHELVTIAVVPQIEVKGLLMILQGLCAMTPVRQLEWRLTFEGPRANPLPGIGPALLQSRKPSNQSLWKELNDQLIRQSYYIVISYDVYSSDFGRGETANVDTAAADGDQSHNLDARKGALQFIDFPDPPGTRSANSRLVIRIKDEAQLPLFMQQIKYSYITDCVRESHYAYRDNVTLCLSRELQRLKRPMPGAGRPLPTSLPVFEELIPFDPENKWTLTASVDVIDGNQPLLVQRGLDQLAQIKLDLEGICEFVMTSRQRLDTRVSAYNQNLRM